MALTAWLPELVEDSWLRIGDGSDYAIASVREEPRMVTAEVKSILLWHNGWQLQPDEAPDDPTHFGISAQMFIGSRGRNAADSFDLLVCSPSWLARQARTGWHDADHGRLTGMRDNILACAGVWLRENWSRSDLEVTLDQICADASPGPDWGGVAARIGRFIPCEFGYKYDEHINRAYGSPYPPGL